jgi:hypothetical protein
MSLGSGIGTVATNIALALRPKAASNRKSLDIKKQQYSEMPSGVNRTKVHQTEVPGDRISNRKGGNACQAVVARVHVAIHGCGNTARTLVFLPSGDVEC